MSEGRDSVFELRRELPDEELLDQGRRLIGFENRFRRLSGQMKLITDVKGLQEWSSKHHKGSDALLAALGDRYPLAVFHGDVGTGKTATAEAAADRLSRELEVDSFLLKLSTRVRGVGHVGEMGTLIGSAFAEARELAGKKRFVALVIDEGDALAFNRSAEKAHHEDRVGVNTLIQKIDGARALKGRLLLFLCTNRFNALDPAVIRRASLIEEFRRPDENERRSLLTADLSGVHIPEEVMDRLVALTGPNNGQPGFTFSDIRTRLVPAAVALAFPSRALSVDDLLAAATEIEPTPEMMGRDR